jgi:hypothetical protein
MGPHSADKEKHAQHIDTGFGLEVTPPAARTLNTLNIFGQGVSHLRFGRLMLEAVTAVVGTVLHCECNFSRNPVLLQTFSMVSVWCCCRFLKFYHYAV